ncbi:hypothetical protein BB560_000361 [Smittium megazygosporum]|uniref:Vacuolar protein-sorting-associated protein 36 n=1 Tax=Smittium megazygosporum TaxID=133381 RepID=A0A2T9ZKM3_9FUNG|nr:hypothetical protein BB560_000361 [Smittium megazygosporum]
MERIELGYTHRPILYEDEVFALISNNVTISLNSESRLPSTVYLTSHRLITVDDANPDSNSFQLRLQNIVSQKTESNFLRTNSKIIIEFNSNSNFFTASDVDENYIFLDSVADKRGLSNLSLGAGLDIPGSTQSQCPWICSICQNMNYTIPGSKCELCGVAGKSVETQQDQEVEHTNTCPSCTFINHPDLKYCEMCDTELYPNLHKLKIQDKPEDQNEPVKSDNCTPPRVLTIRFEKNTAFSFSSTLTKQLEKKLWEVSKNTPLRNLQKQDNRNGNLGGISSIINKSKESEKARNMLLDQALQDLDELSSKAKDIISLAKDIVSKLNQSNNDLSQETGDPDLLIESEFAKYLSKIGIDNPVTKEVAGSSYLRALAREMFEFLEDYVFKNSGIVLVVDAYCLYNKARSFSSVYPSDFIDACKLFGELDLPLKLRKFSSGLLALQASSSANIAISSSIQSEGISGDVFLERINELIDSFGSLSTIQYSVIDGIPLLLANELLFFYEEESFLCRDETIHEVRFYKNVFL